jgi:hypothetical protein
LVFCLEKIEKYMIIFMNQYSVTLETGKKRTFASALDWPGWTRSGRDESEALHALLAYGPRYQQAILAARVNFHPPTNTSEFKVTERLTGNSTTDFGAPGIAPSVDSSPVDTAALQRSLNILQACWGYFGEVVESADGKNLRKGPRGGGRSLVQIVEHVIDSHYSYLGMIYYHEPHEKKNDLAGDLKAIIHADEQALVLAASAEMPKTGPRGGVLWKPRYFVRRAAWHILDHTWEIQDKLEF